jgi:hypothetical protein
MVKCGSRCSVEIKVHLLASGSPLMRLSGVRAVGVEGLNGSLPC